ncbi:hypothetical protein [Rhodoluna sp.]|uniref:hypothetical protein n=1 Tax=Rhodoluna sp. TaxID=1969481 RepID=UPI0025F69120|nr:hypothetical protein [Rhodoluna sp.]
MVKILLGVGLAINFGLLLATLKLENSFSSSENYQNADSVLSALYSGEANLALPVAIVLILDGAVFALATRHGQRWLAWSATFGSTFLIFALYTLAFRNLGSHFSVATVGDAYATAGLVSLVCGIGPGLFFLISESNSLQARKIGWLAAGLVTNFSLAFAQSFTFRNLAIDIDERVALATNIFVAVENFALVGSILLALAFDFFVFSRSKNLIRASWRWASTFGLTGLIIWFHFGLGMYGQGLDEIDADWRYYLAAGIALAAAVIPYLAFERQERKRRWAQPAN